MIRNLSQMEEMVLALKKRQRIAVAWARDVNTIGAIHKAVANGFADALSLIHISEPTRPY